MQPVATTFFFYMLSGLAILGGVLVITRKNAVHSALALILTLLALAGLYLMLYAPFVAACKSFFMPAASWCCSCLSSCL